MRAALRNCVVASLILLGVLPIHSSAQDILIANFESTNYGNWIVTGTAFGSGPAQGTLSNQQFVSGYVGQRLVNTFYNGDGSTGTLTSPPFAIQRKYIRFLIGAGNQRGKTCMNLLVNGAVKRSAVGMGDREQLDWVQWNVSELVGSNAVIQIVDTATGNWGHINVDQILQTDTSLGSVVTVSNSFLNIPVKTGGTRRLFELVVNGLVTHEFFVELADNVTPDFYAFLDLSSLQGKEALVRIDSATASWTSFNSLIWSNGKQNQRCHHAISERGAHLTSKWISASKRSSS